MTIIVVALYSKTTSKNVKHTAITDSSTIGRGTAIKSHQIHKCDEALCKDDHPHLFNLVAYYFDLHIMAASMVMNYYSIMGEQNLNFWGFSLG